MVLFARKYHVIYTSWIRNVEFARKGYRLTMYLKNHGMDLIQNSVSRPIIRPDTCPFFRYPALYKIKYPVFFSEQ